MIIDCKTIADQKIEKIAAETRQLEVKPKIVSMVVGYDGGSESYLNMMEKTFRRAEFETEIVRLDASSSTEDALRKIDEFNADPSVHGVIIHKPLPPQMNEDEMLMRLDPKKDLDGFHPTNLGLMFAGDKKATAPCTAQAVVEVLKASGYELGGKHVVVVGRSNIVGKPLSILLLAENATVTVCHSRTKDLASFTKAADIVVVAVGKPRFLKKDMVTEDTVVIDVGTNNVDGKMVGDADFEELKDYVSAITPVPGGVGRVTNAILLSNALKCFTNK